MFKDIIWKAIADTLLIFLSVVEVAVAFVLMVLCVWGTLAVIHPTMWPALVVALPATIFVGSVVLQYFRRLDRHRRRIVFESWIRDYRYPIPKRPS